VAVSAAIRVVVSLAFGLLSGVCLLTATAAATPSAIIVSSAGKFVDVLIDVLSDTENVSVLLLCAVIGGMIEVIRSTGGFQVLAEVLTKRVNTSRKANIVGEGLGIIVFFDDYANALIVGPIMKPITDRLKISREKLAFLVDSTSAPVTGIAVISSWVGVEVSVIDQSLQGTAVKESAYSLFLKSIPFCFYCIFCLLFIFIGSMMKREYGPMLKAEIRARKGRTFKQSEEVNKEENVSEEYSVGRGKRLFIAISTILLFVVASIQSFYSTGLSNAIQNGVLSGRERFSLYKISIAFGQADTIRLVLYASIISSVYAITLTGIFRLAPIRESVKRWIQGVSDMSLTLVVLTLAWSIAAVIGKLGTAFFITDMVSQNVPWYLIPGIIFIASCFISFAAGSYGCMFMVMPIAVPLACKIMEMGENLPAAFLQICIASVISGGIFGDHCSPITDCTILSSMGSGCSNIDHVETQLPYALTIALVSVLIGTFPAGLGMPPIVSFLIALLVFVLVYKFIGKNPDAEANK
jgi:Na+/H+ antiporter NhaC